MYKKCHVYGKIIVWSTAWSSLRSRIVLTILSELIALFIYLHSAVSEQVADISFFRFKWLRLPQFVSLFLSAEVHHMPRLSEYLCSSSTDFSACSQAHSAERLADGRCQRLVIFTGGAMHVYLNTFVFTFQKGWLPLLKKSF